MYLLMTARNYKAESKPTPLPVGQVNSTSEKVLGFPVTAASPNGGEMVGTVLAPNVATTLELRHPGVDSKANIVTVAPNAVVSSETWVHVCILLLVTLAHCKHQEFNSCMFNYQKI